MAEVLEEKKIYGCTVETYKKVASGKKALVYCVSVKAAKETAQQFTDNGYPADVIYGKMKKHERETIMEKFRRGEITVLTSCDILSEGIDVPDCEVAILLRKTKSLTVYIQQAMRAMRYMQDKTAIIIDHVGNILEHDLPFADRTWTLEEKDKKNEKEYDDTKYFKPKVCKDCNTINPQNLTECFHCGTEFPGRKEYETENEIELQEINAENMRKLQLIKHMKNKSLQKFLAICKSWDELLIYSGYHRYKYTWCYFQIAKNPHIKVENAYHLAKIEAIREQNKKRLADSKTVICITGDREIEKYVQEYAMKYMPKGNNLIVIIEEKTKTIIKLPIKVDLSKEVAYDGMQRHFGYRNVALKNYDDLRFIA